MLSPDRLKRLLTPQGFWLRSSGSVTKEIDFVRPSKIPRIYEHLNVKGQGKIGEAVYARTAVSGSKNPHHDPCVAEIDHNLTFTLETDTERHWTIVRTIEQAREWEGNLARIADGHCRATTEAKGPGLYERLMPAFGVVDRYIEKLGKINDVFDSEYQFFSASTNEQREEAKQLAFRTASLIESSGDTELACLILVKFTFEVEDNLGLVRAKPVHENSELRTRIFLLADYVRECREAYLSQPH